MQNGDDRALEARLDELLGQMTLAEKAAQMVQIPYSVAGREKALEWARRGAGSFLHVLGDDARELQAEALKTRLGIPVLFGIDAIHGHALNERATVFPTQLTAACSWNPSLVWEMGRVTAREVAADGLHWTFSPVLCLGRDTRWGRVGETFGEDPYLAGELGASIVRGYQGERLDDGESILACAKHYIGYGEAIGGRDACDTQMTYRKLREVFLPPFEKAVRAGCATVMTAYGSIDGTPFTACEKALRTILRDELEFDGFVVTDWDNVESLVSRQCAAADLDEASERAALAGNDMIMTTEAFYESVVRLVKSGRLDERVLDGAVRNILRVKLRMGLFERPEKRAAPERIGCAEHRDAALRLARESVVLLKNNGMLPLKQTIKRIAVVGANADDVLAQYGDWTYFTHPTPRKDRAGVRPYVTLLEGMRAEAAKQGAEVVYARGCGPLESEADDLEEAVRIAAGCDCIVLAVGDRIEQAGEFRDRADLALSGRQTELFLLLRALKIPLCVVLISTKPLCLGAAADGADALLAAFNGGMYGGQAAAEALFGAINPGGKLPVSFPRHSGQLPVYYNFLPGWHGGRYVDLPETPLFAFGEGLSYTRFSYANIRWEPETLALTCELTNAGERAGFETAQVYARDLVSSVLTPVKRLIAFQKVYLEPDETRALEFQLDCDDFSLVLPDERRAVEPGEFRLYVGGSSRDEDLLSTVVTL